MFGFSFSELVVVLVVALVVMGPKDLPRVLRKLGQWAGQLRRMAADFRAKSGIDDVLRAEGLDTDIAEIRKLARGELASVQRAARVDDEPRATRAPEPQPYRDEFTVSRDREYPRDGADVYGALPDNAFVYLEGLAKSPLARDPLYVLGDEHGVLPEEPPEPEPEPEPGAEAEAEPQPEAAADGEPATATESPATEAR